MPPALGLGVVAVAVVGIVLMRRVLTWSRALLLAWITVPCLFFEVWAVKGFQYLLPIAVPVAVLAAMVVVSCRCRRCGGGRPRGRSPPRACVRPWRCCWW